MRQAGLDHLKGVSDMEPAILKDILEGAGARESEKLQGQTQYLLDIAVVSPMMGLLGTVFGMLKAFNAVALDVASAKPVVLAGSGYSSQCMCLSFSSMFCRNVHDNHISNPISGCFSCRSGGTFFGVRWRAIGSRLPG